MTRTAIEWVKTYALFLVSGVALFFALAFVGQTIRINGFKLLFIEYPGLKADLAACEADKREMVAASAEAADRALAARNAAQARYSELARNADHEIEQTQRRADMALRDYARRNRVWPEAASGASSGPVAAPGDSGSGVLAELPPSAELVVSFADLQICTDNTVYAIAAHDWAMTLKAAP